MTPRRKIYKLRGVLICLPILFSLVWFRGETDHAAVWPIGVLIFAAGVCGRIWSVLHIQYRLQAPMALALTGPYRMVRNPIYISNVMIFVGMIVISKLLWLVPVMLLWSALIYSFVVREEEARLLKRYGGVYAEYLTQVHRWLPGWGDGSSPTGNHRLATAVWSEAPYLLLIIPFIIKTYGEHR